MIYMFSEEADIYCACSTKFENVNNAEDTFHCKGQGVSCIWKLQFRPLEGCLLILKVV